MIEQLHRAWLGRIRQEWEALNAKRLEGALRLPVFRLLEGGGRLGTWEKAGRLLGIAEAHILADPWHAVVETLAHEMAHQVVDELDGGSSDPPHGAGFKRACRRLGIRPAATGSTAINAESSRVLRRIRKLLALAGSANTHEAENAMMQANALLLRYNLEALEAEGPSPYESRLVGRSAAAIPLLWKQVGAILSEFFFVECIWVGTYNARLDRNQRILELTGTPANLAFAVHVHDFLHASAERLWKEARGEGRRRDFLAGVLAGFSAKLGKQGEKNQEMGLVWLGDPALSSHFRQRYPHTASMSQRPVRDSGAYQRGKREGHALKIHRPMEGGSPSQPPDPREFRRLGR
jgi:hypothetical protein